MRFTSNSRQAHSGHTQERQALQEQKKIMSLYVSRRGRLMLWLFKTFYGLSCACCKSSSTASTCTWKRLRSAGSGIST